MASIFTYELEPVRLASPWPSRTLRRQTEPETCPVVLCGIRTPPEEDLANLGISRLDAEPQDGPVEYKLHLLLRPRRSYSAMSTARKISGSHLSKARPVANLVDNEDRPQSTSTNLPPSSHTRQNRLQHLTTQLLWRLQQSSPSHPTSKSGLTVPVLPELSIASPSPNSPSPLVAGLEESQGALYEIGISDDGAFVGLTMDELEESVRVLRIMADSLGCRSQMRRIVKVGRCAWPETDNFDTDQPRLRQEDLWVAEVLVGPRLSLHSSSLVEPNDSKNGHAEPSEPSSPRAKPPTAASLQLRVSLTGSTTSGKSSLLGTLSTSTLDNGRGKSRLSLLRHRHEIVSGITSSLAQELIGYQNPVKTGPGSLSAHISNYSSGNISSWADIHTSSQGGRLVFFTDSAGHPKFRRTTARGLISWAPHWTICCVAADEGDENNVPDGTAGSQDDIVGTQGDGAASSKAHLELCLKLNLPLICVVTKLDLASKAGLRQTVSRILSLLKLAGRRPAVLPASPLAAGASLKQTIANDDLMTVQKLWKDMSPEESFNTVPIIITSTVTGCGINQLHSLLSLLPVSNSQDGIALDPRLGLHVEDLDVRFRRLFHIDEIFVSGATNTDSSAPEPSTNPRFILSGYLRRGLLQTGDSLLLGPFYSDSQESGTERLHGCRSASFPRLSKSLPQDLASIPKDRLRSPDILRESASDRDRDGIVQDARPLWYPVIVESLRNLRFPVSQLSEGHVGTVAVSCLQPLYTNAEPCLRRGMILCEHPPLSDCMPPAYRSITAVFADPNLYVNPGSSVTIYTASIRAPARIVDVKVPEGVQSEDLSDSGIFSFDQAGEGDTATFPASNGKPISELKEIEITFKFTNSIEWVELGTRVLVTPASGISMLSASTSGTSGSAVSGLDGFVGKIVSAM